MCLLGLVCYAVFRKWMNGWLAIIPALLVVGWEVMRFCGLLYPLSSTLALIGGGGLFLLYDWIKNSYLRIGTGFVGVILGYWLFGYGMFVFLFFQVIASLIQRREMVWVGLTIIVAIALPGIGSRHYLLTYSQACQYPATAWWDKPNPLYERLIGVDIEAEAGHWKKVRHEIPAYPVEYKVLQPVGERQNPRKGKRTRPAMAEREKSLYPPVGYGTRIHHRRGQIAPSPA